MLVSGWEFLAHLHFIPRCPHGLPWHACVKNYKRLSLNKTQLFSTEIILQSSAQCKIFSLFSIYHEPLRKLLLGNSRSSSEILFGHGVTDASTSGDDSESSCHLSTSPNTQGMVSHRHKTHLSSRRFLLDLTEKQGKGIDCNGFSLPLFSIPRFLRILQRFPMVLPNFLNNCLIHQDLVEHVDNQKHFQEYSYSLMYFAAFQLRGSACLNLDVIRAMMTNVGLS